MLMKFILHSEITYLCIKIFFSMFIQMFFLKFIAPLKGDVSISKVTINLNLILSFKLTRTRNTWSNKEEILKIMKTFVTGHLSINKNQ